MIAVIGEKPSVARDIARILGASEKQDGYFSGNGYLVTWAFGHLVGLAMPEAYGIQSFRRESLPIIPDSFQLTPRQVKAEKGYKADPGALKQLKVIKEVFDQSDKIIVATDAGREENSYLDIFTITLMQQALCPFMDKQPYRQVNP